MAIAQGDDPTQMEISAGTSTSTKQSMVLNGTAIRSMLIWDVYKGEFFLEEKSSDAAKIIASPERKQMRMTFMRSADAEKIRGGWEKGLTKNAPELDQSRPTVKQFLGAMPAVEEDDVVEITLQGTQAVLRKNNTVLDAVTDEHLVKALPKVWIGEDPPSEKFKNGVLGIAE